MAFPIAVNLDWEEMTTERSVQKFPLGSVGRMLDGRSFRYTQNGDTALRAGCVVQSPAPLVISASGSSGPNVLIAGSTYTSTWKVLTIGTTNTTAVTKDYFKDGWLYVSSTNHATLVGQMLQIKGNIASTAAVAYPQTLSLELYAGQHLTQTLNTSDYGISIARNPYASVIVVAQGAAPTGDILGVPAIPITANYYFWLQTWGLAAVEASTALSAIGSGVVYSTDAANTGIDDIYATTGIGGLNSIGTIKATSVAGAHALVDLRIQP